jgi:hypothetical protein
MWIVAPRAHSIGVGKVRILKRRRLVTLHANDGIRRLKNHITRIPAVLHAVAGGTSALDSRMNVDAGRMVGMAFQAVGVVIETSRVRTRIAQTRTQQEDAHPAKWQPRRKSHSSPRLSVVDYRSWFEPCPAPVTVAGDLRRTRYGEKGVTSSANLSLAE